MKTLVASALAASVLFTGAAHAFTGAAQLSPEVKFILPNADYSNLTDSQVSAINAAVHTGDSHNEKQAVIRSILN